MKCPACGRENRSEAAFCDGCGASLAPECPSCHAKLRVDARFCDACGSSVAPVPDDIRVRTPEHLAKKILDERGRIEGERRTVTVMFADAKGFTPLSEKMDAEEVYGFVQQCIERMVSAVHDHEGTVTQFTGDGIVALFGAPIAHEDSARRAVSAALQIQRAVSSYIESSGLDTSFRVGLNTGPVVVGRISDDLSMDYTAVGDTVNLAARMEQMAEPGSVYLTENTYRQIADYIECVDLGPQDVKGKSEPVHIYRAVSERGVKTRLDAAVARGLSPFVGRDRDIDVLKGLWQDALAGRGQIVMISGEPGIGKSRLLLEFHRALGDDVIWREAHCVSYGENIPYLPVVELVKAGFGVTDTDDEGTIIGRVDLDVETWTPEAQKLVPYLKFLLQVDPGDAAIELMDPVDRRAGILDALRMLIIERSRVAPRVVVVEDLHWADSNSEEAFRVCADAVAASQVLMILTFRPGYMHPSGDLPNAHRIVLGDLDSAARNELAGATLEASALSSDLIAPVTQKAEGNPLFIEEVTKALADGVTSADAVPTSLQDVILARIDRLEKRAREALQFASVIGREFTMRLLDRISDLEAQLEGVLSELKSLELIYEKTFFPELAYMFKHALTHDVAYSTLLVERRKALHRVVASAIEELYTDRIAEHYETLAHHYVQAELWDKAFEYLVKSGDKASAAFANPEAIGFYRRALELIDRGDAGNRHIGAEIAEKIGFVYLTIGDLGNCIASFERMLAFARELDDQRLVSASLSRRGMAELMAHDFDRSEETLRGALSSATDDNTYFVASMWLDMLCLITNRHDEAAVFAADCKARLSAVDDGFALGFWDEFTVILPAWKADFTDAIDIWTRMSAKTGESSTQYEEMANLGATWAAALSLCGSGRYDEAISTLEFVLARTERIGDVFFRIRALNSLGWVYIELQDLEKGRYWNQRALDVALEIGIADSELDSNAHLNLADVLIAQGRLDEAEPYLATVEAIARNPAPEQRWMLWRYTQHLLHSYGELRLLRGDTGRARENAEQCIAMATKSGAKKNIAKGQRLLGQALSAAGDHAAAVDAITVAVDVARDIGNPTQLWKSLAALGDVRAAAGHADAASQAFAEASKVIDDLASGLSDAALHDTFVGSAAVTAIREKATAT